MPQGIPLDDETRAAILNDIRAGQKSCRGIARQHNVSDATVRKIAKDNNITDAFSRANTEKATRARVADMASIRTAKAAVLLEDFDRLRERAWSEYQVVVGGREGAEIVDLKLPPLRDAQAAYTSMAICIDKHLALVKHDSDGGASEARSMLSAIAEALEVAAQQLPADDAG